MSGRDASKLSAVHPERSLSRATSRGRGLPLKWAAAGALIGAALFALEAVLLFRSGQVGFAIDTQGPFAAVMATVKPALIGVLARVLLVYLCAGAVVGLTSAALTFVARPTSRLARAGLWLFHCALIWGLWAGHRAVLRPALFDDVAVLRPALSWLTVHAQPGHFLIPFIIYLVAHAAWGAVRWRSQLAQALQTVNATVRRRSKLAIALALASLGFVTLSQVLSGPGPRGPLLVLIGIDAFRPDRLSAFSGRSDVAPNLERFTQDATVFTRAYTPIAQTEPAWRSLLTARWPNETGVRYPLTAESRWAALPTFSQSLRSHGFHTVFATDCSRFNFQPESAGFDERRQPPRGALNFALEKLRFRVVGMAADNALGAALLPELVDNRALAGIHDPFGYADRLADRLTDLGSRGAAFFAWHSTASHFPGDPSYPFYRQRLGDEVPLERRVRMVFSPIASGAGQAAQTSAGSREVAEALYDELLAQADAQVGILLDALKRSGQYDDAWVVVFSDHGESFHLDTPALWGATSVHGARLTEEENRILLAVKPPHAHGAQKVDTLVRLLDIGPTLLDAARVPALAGAEGKSLVPLLHGEPLAPGWLYAETGFTHASPAAFDPQHWAKAARSFDAYTVRADGVVELSPSAHDAVMSEKDFGAFDGIHWLIRSPRADGSTQERCDGNCDALRAFLDSERAPRG